MRIRRAKSFLRVSTICLLLGVALTHSGAVAADKLVALYSARVMSQAMPWIGQEAGLFKKYDLDLQLVYVGGGPPAAAAALAGDTEVTLVGASSIVRPFVQGSRDLVFIGAIKNILTHSILAKPDIKRPDALKGKKIGVTRIGSNPHYFAVQALRHFGIDSRDVAFIQTGGAPETLAALVSESIDAAVLTAPTDSQAIALGYHYVVYGPDLHIPYAATTLVTRRPIMAKRGPVVDRFMRVMAEAAKILHTDKEFTYRVLAKQLRLDDRKILEASYNGEIKALEPKMMIRPDAIQSTLDEIAPSEPRAKNVKPQELIDTRYLDEMEKSGFFDQLWSGKR